MNSFEAHELACDWISLIEKEAARTDDPVELAELDAELDEALSILERAASLLECKPSLRQSCSRADRLRPIAGWLGWPK
jgi:hypothetical protein